MVNILKVNLLELYIYKVVNPLPKKKNNNNKVVNPNLISLTT